MALPFEAAQRELKAAIRERDKLEAEAEAITSELESPGPNGAPPATIKAPLVDNEGYPRADIDVHRARHLRHRLACLQTDHKATMIKIEQLLPIVLAPQAGTTEETMRAKHLLPFAKITQVRLGSPADKAGFREEDEVLSFGEAQTLGSLKTWTLAHVNEKVDVIVKRGDHRIHLHVIPAAWVGDGLLGCNFHPIVS